MTDASAVSATNLSWIQQAGNNPVEFLKTLDDLLENFGPQELSNATTQQFVGKFIESLRGLIDSSELPQGIKDGANAVLDSFASTMPETCPCSSQASDAVAGSAQSDAIDQSAEATAEAVVESTNEGTSTAEGAEPPSGDDAVNAAINSNQQLEEDSKPDKSGKGKNWMEVLAENLADIQAKFLNKALAASEVMQAESGNAAGEGSGATPSTAFLKAQSEFTANMQLFNLFANQSATALKTIGEGLSGIARKQ